MIPSLRTRRVLMLGAAVVALTVTSCRRPEEKAAAPSPAPSAAPSAPVQAAPVDYVSKTPYAEVELKLPPAIKGQPALHRLLYDAGIRDLRAFSEGSQADRTEAGGDPGMGLYEKVITFDTPAETGKLFGLARSDYEFTGGAHGGTTYSGVIWDKALNRQVEGAALFRKGADFSALDSALCAALNVEKKKRDPAATPVVLTSSKDGWSCPHASEIPFALAAGTTPGKVGGLIFLVGPYQVGPYSDGAYWVTLPQTVVRPLLDPAYADEFAGAPAPLPSAAGR